MIYFDTAYIVKCYVHEPGSPAVRRLLAEHQNAACCVVGRLEFAAAVKRAIREGRLDSRVLNTVFSVLDHDDQNAAWTWLPLTSSLVEVATQAVRNLPENVYIRSADALHIAYARENGCGEIYSNDRHILAAARYFGVQAVNVIS